MPILPVPLPVLPSGGDLPVRTTADVLAAYPDHVRREVNAPVRDALIEAKTEMFLGYQEHVDYAAAQSDPTRATGLYLEEFTNEVGIFKQDGEKDESLRERYFAVPELVTPEAIKGAVDSILAPFTTKTCFLCESVLDRWFVSDGASSWHSFVGDGTSDMTPDYPDRRYATRAGSSPGGALAFSDGEGRFFILRIPNISATADAAAVAADGAAVLNGEGVDVSATRLYADDGTDADGSSAMFVFAGLGSADSVYQAIVNTVETIRGHGIRVRLLVDSKL